MRPSSNHQLGTKVCTSGYWQALAAAALCVMPANGAAAQSGAFSGVRFDVPQVAEALPVATAQGDASELLVAVELTLSVIVDSLSAPPIDQLVIEITPRGGTAIVADYAPRTELASEYAGGIEVQQSGESSQSLALTLEGRYPPLANGALNAGKSEKNTALTKYNRVAPMHLIAASGTTQRGRGVYFKFRATDQQIIEGDRLLSLILRVPASWRGEQLDVLIQGESQPRGLAWGVGSLGTAKPQRVGMARFLVTTYRADDPEARQLARRLADAETQMRSQIHDRSQESLISTAASPAALLRQVSRIQWTQNDRREQAAVVLHKALAGTLHPHVDHDFKELPVDARASCLDYLAVRRQYLALTGQSKNTAEIAEGHHECAASGEESGADETMVSAEPAENAPPARS